MTNFSSSSKKGLLVVLALGLAAGTVWLLSLALPPAIDWDKTYVPVAQAVLAGRSPYSVEGFYNPVWALIPILPLALLPPAVGRAVFFLVSLSAFAYAVYRLGAKPLAMGAFLASPPVMHCLLHANVEWMPVLGCVLAPRWGLFLVLVKPQMGAAMALFWLVEAWRTGGWRRVVYVFWPVTAALALTVLVFGAWFASFGEAVNFDWNASLWPASIPVGLALMVAALRVRRKELAMAAAPCLSPYVVFHSWAIALAAIVSLPLETVAAVIGLWLLLAIRWQGYYGDPTGGMLPGLSTFFG